MTRKAKVALHQRPGQFIEIPKDPDGAYDAAGTASATMAAHVATADPHPQYTTAAELAAAIAALVNSSPVTLDTLAELATALGNDPNFATTMATALGLKAPLASPALTGTPTAPTAAPGTNTTQISTTAFVAAAIAAIGASYTDEQAQDAAAAMIVAGAHVGLTVSYNDAGNSLVFTVTGGGGNVTTENTWAARPGSPASGDVHFVTDTHSSARWNGTSWTHKIGTEIIVPPVLADFAWVNQGTSTIAALGPFAKMSPQLTGSYNFRIQKKAVLAKPYNIELGLVLPNIIQGSVDMIFGILLRQSSSGRLVVFGIDFASSLFRVLYMNSPTSAFSAPASVAVNRPIGLLKFRIREDATNIYCDNYLGNGVWKNYFTASRTAWLTVSGADEAGWGGNMPTALDIDSVNWDHWKEY